MAQSNLSNEKEDRDGCQKHKVGFAMDDRIVVSAHTTIDIHGQTKNELSLCESLFESVSSLSASLVQTRLRSCFQNRICRDPDERDRTCIVHKGGEVLKNKYFGSQNPKILSKIFLRKKPNGFFIYCEKCPRLNYLTLHHSCFDDRSWMLLYYFISINKK